MSKRAGRTWWSALGLGKTVVDDGDDFGDMGTAFGLDASMASEMPDHAAAANRGADAPKPATDRHWRRSAF
jgi:hypothetical protein